MRRRIWRSRGEAVWSVLEMNNLDQCCLRRKSTTATHAQRKQMHSSTREPPLVNPSSAVPRRRGSRAQSHVRQRDSRGARAGKGAISMYLVVTNNTAQRRLPNPDIPNCTAYLPNSSHPTHLPSIHRPCQRHTLAKRTQTALPRRRRRLSRYRRSMRRWSASRTPLPRLAVEPIPPSPARCVAGAPWTRRPAARARTATATATARCVGWLWAACARRRSRCGAPGPVVGRVHAVWASAGLPRDAAVGALGVSVLAPAAVARGPGAFVAVFCAGAPALLGAEGAQAPPCVATAVVGVARGGGGLRVRR